MTGPATGAPERGSETPKRTAGTRDAASAILIVLALGLAFRLILAHVLPGSGFKVDLIAFRFWADDLARNAFLTAAVSEAEDSPGGLMMPNQSLLYAGLYKDLYNWGTR